MQPDDVESRIERLQRAIAVQEGLRGTLDDAVIDITISALRAQLGELEAEPAAKQQRKLLTILFVDVVGSTQMTRELDPEEILDVMDMALKRLAGPIEARGGRVLRFMGDGYLAAFGLPRARENDPEMAVRAGLDVLEIAGAVAAELQDEKQIHDFHVRVGANTGLVVAGGITEGEDTIMGPAVNLAARLESAAPTGGLLISHDTYQHVQGLFEVEAHEPIAAKGFGEPVKAYLVRRARQFTFDLTSRGMEGVETRMIGREAELAALQQAMALVTAGEGGRSITVIGEAGLGKSRLLAEFERWLDAEAVEVELFKGRATLETRNWPYSLLRGMIATRLGILEDDPIAEVRVKIEAAFRAADLEGEHHERNAHFVGQLLGYDFADSPHLQDALRDPRQLRDRAQAYLQDFFGARSAALPVVIFLDDVHWADSSSLELLLSVFAELENKPILVVALARRTLLERFPEWGTMADHQQIQLKSLSRVQSERMVAQALQKVQDLPDPLRDLLIGNAEGNPFYLEELIKMLVEDGVIVTSEPTWTIRTDLLGDLRIPATLTGVIQARLDSLPPAQRRALRQASVVGRVFWDEAVGHIGQQEADGNLTSDETKRYLGMLEERGMVFSQDSSTFSDANEYLFKHSILRDVTYESVLKRVRRAYHALVADWLIAHSGERSNEVSGLIAGHFELAGDTGKALEYLQRAAELARSNYALVEAIDLYTRALALAPEGDHERRYILLKGRTAVLADQANRVAQLLDLESRAAIADLLDDDGKRAEVSNERAWHAFFTGEYREAIAAARRTIGLAGAQGWFDDVAEAHRILAWAHRQLDDFEAASRHAETGLALSQKSSNRLLQVNLQTTASVLRLALGHYSTAREHSEKALVLSETVGNISTEAKSLCNSGVPLTVLGDYEVAAARYRRGLEIAAETHNRSTEVTALINLGWIHASRGDWEQAREYALAGVDLARKIGYVEALAESLMWLGHAWLGLGQPERASASYQEALDIRRDLGQTNLAMGATAGLARAALAVSDHEAALDRVEVILRYFAEGGNLAGTWEPLRIQLTCYRVLEAVGDPRAVDELKRAFDDLQQRAARITDGRDRQLYLEKVPWHREIVSVWNAKAA